MLKPRYDAIINSDNSIDWLRKMGIFNFLGGTAKSCVNVKGWVSYDFLKNHSASLSGMIRRNFTPAKASYEETFEEAITRLNLTAADLLRLQKRFLLHTYFYLGVASLAILYMFYLLWHGHLFPAIITLLIAAALGVKAFGTHFYCFQIKHRKLGCTFQEWLKGHTIEEEENEKDS